MYLILTCTLIIIERSWNKVESVRQEMWEEIGCKLSWFCLFMIIYLTVCMMIMWLSYQLTKKAGSWIPRLERMVQSRGLCPFEKQVLLTLIGFVIQPNKVIITMTGIPLLHTPVHIHSHDILILHCNYMYIVSANNMITFEVPTSVCTCTQNLTVLCVYHFTWMRYRVDRFYCSVMHM